MRLRLVDRLDGSSFISISVLVTNQETVDM